MTRKYPSASGQPRVGEPVSTRTGARTAVVIGIADDAPMVLVRWDGSRDCDWLKLEEIQPVVAQGPENARPKGE